LDKERPQGADADAAAARLGQENERQGRQLRQAREEAERLEEEIRRLRRPPEGRRPGPKG
jgi:hypothetical protein